MRITLLVGTRPNIVKAAALVPALKAAGHGVTLVHSRQHNSEEMSGRFFKELEIDPDVLLPDSGSVSTLQRFSYIMNDFGFMLKSTKPDLVMVVGDCDTALAGALAAKKLGVQVAHVEAGLRAPDAVQENLNRRLVDHASDWNFASEESAILNLAAEKCGWFYPGNVMIDTLLRFKGNARARGVPYPQEKRYAVLTLHRAENVDDPARFQDVLYATSPVREKMKMIFPVHPRTRSAMRRLGSVLLNNVEMIEPLGYLDFINLISRATVVLTDSGGVQEETTALFVPCLTLREWTERPATMDHGTNTIVGLNVTLIREIVDRIINKLSLMKGRGPSLWDGHAAERIAHILSSKEVAACM